MERNQRKQERMKRSIKAYVSYPDVHLQYQTGPARVVDVSEGGLRFESRASIAKGSPVSVRVERIVQPISGFVRHCVRSGPRYLTGIEIRGTAPLRLMEMPPVAGGPPAGPPEGATV